MSASDGKEIHIPGDGPARGSRRPWHVALAMAGLALALIGTLPLQAWIWPELRVPWWLLALADWGFLGIVIAAMLIAVAVTIVILWVGRRPLPESVKKLLHGQLGWRDALLMMLATAISLALAMMILRRYRLGDGVAESVPGEEEAAQAQTAGALSLAWSWTSEWAQWLFDLLFPVFSIVLVVLGFVCFVAMMLARARARAAAAAREKADPLEDAVATAADEGLDDLDAGGDPRAAIIRCYARFERSLAAAESGRAAWQTPIEFMRAVLASLPVAARDVERLTSLFQRARFSLHPMDGSDRQAAIEALAAIRAALCARAAERGADAAAE
jgi:hypothetical protein